MEGISVNLTFTTESIIAILGIVVTIFIAAIGGIYAIVTNTKKYELTENYRKELLQWYSSAVNLMSKIIHYSECEKFYSPEFAEQRMAMLSELGGKILFSKCNKGGQLWNRKAFCISRIQTYKFGVFIALLSYCFQ